MSGFRGLQRPFILSLCLVAPVIGQWLALPVKKDELRYETLLKLFFGEEAGPDISLEHIKDFENKIRAELPFLQQATRRLQGIQDEKAHRYYLLTAMFGERVYKAYLEWCEDAKKILEG